MSPGRALSLMLTVGVASASSGRCSKQEVLRFTVQGVCGCVRVAHHMVSSAMTTSRLFDVFSCLFFLIIDAQSEVT